MTGDEVLNKFKAATSGLGMRETCCFIGVLIVALCSVLSDSAIDAAFEEATKDVRK